MSPDDANGQRHVVVVGGGFAGVGCAQRLAKQDDVRVTLIDRHNYHQFQPLLYQVATSQLALERHRVLAAQAVPRRRRTSTSSSARWPRSTRPPAPSRRRRRALRGRRARARRGLAAELLPHARAPRSTRFPLYSLDDATRLRSRILGVFEAPTATPSLLDQGALTFVVVGGGPTGVELAGALADLIAETMTAEYHHLAVTAAQIHLVDLGHTLLGPFSDRAHDYAAKVLGRKGVRLHLGVAVTEIGPGT